MPREASGVGKGRAAKPTALKLLHGEDKHDPQRINRNEPVPSDADGAITPPDDLSDAAREVWDRLAPDLIRTGVLTAWDVDSFRTTCNAVADYKRARALVDKSGPLVQGANGLKMNPAITAMNKAEQTFLAYGGRFGLTPSDRSKIKADPPGSGAGATTAKGSEPKSAARLLS